MILAAWNVNSLNVRLPRLLDWLAAHAPDVVCLQETKLEDAKFPALETRRGRLHRALRGPEDLQRRRDPRPKSGLDATDVAIGIPGLRRRAEARDRRHGRRHPRRRRLRAQRPVRRLGQVPVQARVVRRARGDAARRARAPSALAVLGDFNVAPEDRDVHDPALWAGQVLCSEPERAAFRALLDAGLADSFRLFDQPPEDVLVVGLPAARVPEEPRPAHRPRPAVAAAGAALHREPHRPQRAQGREAFRSRTGAGGTARLKQRRDRLRCRRNDP